MENMNEVFLEFLLVFLSFNLTSFGNLQCRKMLKIKFGGWKQTKKIWKNKDI